MNNDERTISIELNQIQAALVIKAITALPLAMSDPMHKAAISVYDKIKAQAQEQIKIDMKLAKEKHE